MAQEGTDFARYSQLSESELEALEKALSFIPDDILSTGDRRSIDSRIKRILQQEGVIYTGEEEGPPGVTEIPPVAFVGRAVGCLAASYVALRGISHNKPAVTVAESIARAMAGCSSGGVEAVTSDILKHRGHVAGALTALGLPALGDALVAGDIED